jgi:ATP-dependent RNA helicase DHX37/DHR1
MTDGILLKELETDFLLKKYSVIIVDEAHERSLNSDILVSLLTRIAHARCEKAFKERQQGELKTFPLRLIIMSATLRVTDFKDNERLFPVKEERPRVIKVEARQFPVSVHFSKVTKDDFQEEAYRKAVKIHKTLPSGGILIFLTGKKEITYMCKRLNLALKKRKVGMKRSKIQ